MLIVRSACGASVSVSVLLLFAKFVSLTPAGAVIDAELTSEPVTELLIEQVAENVTLAPPGRLTELLMLPEPDAEQVPPFAPLQVQVQELSDCGNVSVTVAPETLLDPAELDAVIV